MQDGGDDRRRASPELLDGDRAFRAHTARRRGPRRRRARSEYRLRELLSQRFMDHLERDVLAPGELDAIVERIAARELDPYTAADELMARAAQIGPIANADQRTPG